LRSRHGVFWWEAGGGDAAIRKETAMDIAHFQQKLEARRDELRRRLGRIEHDLEEPQPADWEDRVSEREGDEVLEDLGTSGLQELRMIDAALSRVADGSYGICVNCGEEISEARLEAVPHAARCRNCA
jgi:RNA polymerase-binding transcription factor DksA